MLQYCQVRNNGLLLFLIMLLCKKYNSDNSMYFSRLELSDSNENENENEGAFCSAIAMSLHSSQPDPADLWALIFLF